MFWVEMRHILLPNTLRRTVFGALAAMALASSLFARAGSIGAAEVALVQRHVETLASERMEGRLTGTVGERRAGDYIVGALKALGAPRHREPARGGIFAARRRAHDRREGGS